MSPLRYRIGLLASALLLAACGDGVARAAEGSESPVAAEVPAGEVVRVVSCRDPQLAEVVEVREVERQRCQPHRQLQVALDVRNQSEAPLCFGVQVQFLDADYTPYGDRSTRRVVNLDPGSTRRIVATSDREKATDIVVRLTPW